MSAGKTALLRACRDFAQRSDRAEWLDQPHRDPGELAPVLRDLARLNGATLGRLPILRWLRPAIAAVPKGQNVSLVDAGCGYGDLLRSVRHWARRRGVAIALCGVDVDPRIIHIARAATNERDRIDFAVADILHYRPAAPVDLIVSSLLAHHLADRAIVDLLHWMEQTARRGWLVCDLQRHPLPYAAIGLAGKLARLHPTVIDDGRISVTRALNRSEWEARLDEAGIPRRDVTIRWFLFRYMIGRLR
jgi:SAM-dependent methyltransferase